jgi:hypothetical protein
MGSEGERSGLVGVSGSVVVRLTGNITLAGHGKAKRGGQQLRTFKADSQRRNREGMGDGGALATHADQRRPWQAAEEESPNRASP